MKSKQGLQTLRNLLYKVPLRALLVPAVAVQAPPTEKSPGSRTAAAPSHDHENSSSRSNNNNGVQLPLITDGHHLGIRNNLDTPSLPEMLDIVVADEVAARTRPNFDPPAGVSAPIIAQIEGSLPNREYSGQLDSVSRLPYHASINQTVYSGDSSGPVLRRIGPEGEADQVDEQGPADGVGPMDVEPGRVLQSADAEVMGGARRTDAKDGCQRTEGNSKDERDPTGDFFRLVEVVLVKLEAAPSGEDCDESSSAVRTNKSFRVIT